MLATKTQLANLVKKLKNWWIGLTDYLKASASDTWKNVDEMFAEFDKEGYVIPASDFDAGTKKECAFPPFCFVVLFTVRQMQVFLVFLQGCAKV